MNKRERSFRTVEAAVGLSYGSIRRRWDDESEEETRERNAAGLQRLLASLARPRSPATLSVQHARSVEARVATVVTQSSPLLAPSSTPCHGKHHPLLPAVEGRLLRSLLEVHGIRRRDHVAFLGGCRLGPYYEFGHLITSPVWSQLRSTAARAFSDHLHDLGVDRVVGYSSVMYEVAQATAGLLGLSPYHAVLAIGDEHPAPVVPLCEFFGLRVAILVDGVMSGTLLDDLTQVLTLAGADVVFQGCLVAYPGAKAKNLHYLWEDEADTYAQPCPACAAGARPKGFRPSHGATSSDNVPPEAIMRWREHVASTPQLWKWIARTNAFRTDVRLGGYYYDVFLDTVRLLGDSLVHAAAVSMTQSLLSHIHALKPIVIYGAGRSRYPAVAADMVAKAFGWDVVAVPLIGGRWAPKLGNLGIRGRNVLIADSAVSSGGTMQLLASFARVRDALSVRGFALISRLVTPEATSILARTLDDPLFSLFYFPLQPSRLRAKPNDRLATLLDEFAQEPSTAPFVHDERNPRRPPKLEPGRALPAEAIQRAIDAAICRRYETLFAGLATNRDIGLALRVLPKLWIDTPLIREELCALLQNGIPASIKVTIARHLLRHNCHAWVHPGWLTENVDVLAQRKGSSVVIAIAASARTRPETKPALRKEAAKLRDELRTSQGLLPTMSPNLLSRHLDTLVKKLT